ncbi:MAG: tRNA (adenosine(37)-N6)-threonylcarbamoyltransferase complex dimerization subunit type 1 TsaB [Flavobacteriales bacterium]
MSLIINIETSGKACSVALSQSGELIGSRYQISENYPHSQVLHVFIDEILKEKGLKPSELNAVSVSSGPGSYTGLRIGVSAAKGLCFALDIPLIEISTLLLIAKAASVIDSKAEFYIPMIDARRMEVYTQTFNTELTPMNDARPLIITEGLFSEYHSRQVILCGDGSHKCKDAFSNNSNINILPSVLPLAENMCQLAHKKFGEKQFVDVNYFEPFYLKEFQSQSAFHKK